MTASSAVTRLSARSRPSIEARVEAGAAAFNEAVRRLDTSLSRLVAAGETNAASARAALRVGVDAFRAEWERQRRRRGRAPLRSVR